jgi:UDP-glucose 4-epimerase
MRASGVGGVFNLATGTETDVLTIFSLLRAAANIEIEGELAPLREGELQRSCMDPAVAARELDWRAQIPVSEGVPATYHTLVAAFASGSAR